MAQDLPQLPPGVETQVLASSTLRPEDTPGDADLGERFVLGFRRSVSRRTFLSRALTWGFAAGTAATVGLTRPDKALASNCNVYGAVSTWGNFCAQTGSCSSCASLGRCYFDRRRCNYWAAGNSEGQFCWCSQTANVGGCYGYYVCCDCWTSAPSSCQNRPNPCICSHRHCI